MLIKKEMMKKLDSLNNHEVIVKSRTKWGMSKCKLMLGRTKDSCMIILMCSSNSQDLLPIQIQQMRFRTSFHQNGERQLQRTLPTGISSLLWNKESTSLPIHHLFTHWTRNTKNSSKKRNDKQKQDLQRGSPTQRRNWNPFLSPMTILHPPPHHLPKKPVSLQKWCPISKTSTRTSSIGFTPSNPSTPAILFFPKWPPKQNDKIQ